MIECRGVIFTDAKYLGEEVAFRPDDAVDRLTWSAADGADGETFGDFFGVAIVAFGLTLDSRQLVFFRTEMERTTLTMTCTWPLNPVVPLSIKGTLAAKHILLTCRLASRLSSALKTRLNPPNQSTLKVESLILA